MDISNKEFISFFKNQKVEITLFPEERVVKFSSIKRFRDYIIKECQFWDELAAGRASMFRAFYNDILNRINNAINVSLDLQNSMDHLIGAINLASSNNLNNYYSETEAAQKLKELYQRSYMCADAYVDFITNSAFTNLNNREYFYGAIKTMEFFNRTDRSDLIAAKENLLKELTERFSTQIDSLDSEYIETKSKIETETDALQNEILNWKTSTMNELNSFLSEKSDALNSLEKTYQENLRLKEPAEYWNNLHEHYLINGDKWRSWAIGTSVAMMALLVVIFFNLPVEFYGKITEFKFETVRSIMILAVIISIGVYMLRLFVKLAISAYHLARDAKERYELTYFYLSLINEGAITEENRSIVLNSLFSRADTGLLKGDSAPTIPEGMVQQVVKMMRT